MMLTVPEAAQRVRRNPETVRRWIREGRLRHTRLGTQYFIDEADLQAVLSADTVVALPDWMRLRPDGRPQPDWAGLVRDGRRSH